MTKTGFIGAVVALAVALTAGSAFARSDDNREAISFEALDANGDGQVTREEMQEQHSRRMLQADTNGDGQLSLQEIEAHAAARAAEHAGRMMERRDANGDGLLSADELAGGPRSEKRFKRADSNGDGMLSKQEFDAARDRMGRHHKKHDGN
jgi:Ca2+-binding EF-hand superfamily protein